MEKGQTLVSCIMPTYNRREFIPNAIRYFLRQEYDNKELIIIDDGTDAIYDLVPDNPAIHYYRLDCKKTLGAKLNLACAYSKGKIIAHWDDDDWYSSRRIKYQVDTLQNKGTEVCGINHLFYYDLCNQRAYQYIYPATERTWLLGSSLCYNKELWHKNNFADIDVGMDALFVWATSPERITVLPDPTIAVHMIHKNNISPKKTDGGWWHPYQVEEIQKIVNSDWVYYQKNTKAIEVKVDAADAHLPRGEQIYAPIKNIYACLIHENEDCVIDMVRNLHYHDPASVILLYNGGVNEGLIQKDFPYEKFGAVLHPDPAPVRYGYLHNFAVDCMQFAVENFSFDTITFVDSDQLAIRPGYSQYMGEVFSSTSDIGLLSNKPKRITLDDKNDIEVWPAIQAFKEYDLWKPFLKSFNRGEDNFVHWTFWPSTVFTKDAIKDLIRLFKDNKQLQGIMEKTKIWASEEVILPTLVRLLGYKIVANPCSYQYVKYKKNYLPEETNDALHNINAYWMHPVDRKYENATRKYIREHFNHYAKEKKEEESKSSSSPNLLLTVSLLQRIKNIEGWLDDQEADLLIAITVKACQDTSVLKNIVEIGSYHGKSTILFGSVAKTCYPDAKVYAIDTHDGKLGSADQGLHSFPPSYEAFQRNIINGGLSEFVSIIRDHAYNVEWNAPISLLFIDGLHDYINVSKDFWHFSNWIRPGGYVAFHDYADYFPGVQAFVNELLEMGNYHKVHQVKSLLVAQKM